MPPYRPIGSTWIAATETMWVPFCSVEVIQIRGVLEVVGVDLAAVYDVVGLYIVGEFDDIQGDVLLGQNFLGNFQNFCVGGRGSGDGRSSAPAKCVVIDGRAS